MTSHGDTAALPWFNESTPRAEPELFRHGKLLPPTWRDVLIGMTLRSTGFLVMELLRLEGRYYTLSSPDFFLLVRRSKRRSKQGEYERVYLPPGLGVELRDYVTGNRIAPDHRVFSITDRQVRYVFAARTPSPLREDVD